MGKSIEDILTSVSPEIARRVAEQKAKDRAVKKRLMTEPAEFQAAERATTTSSVSPGQKRGRLRSWLSS